MTGPTFGRAALRLAGSIPRLLGWRPAEFWNATPAELAAILSDEEPPGDTPLSRNELVALMEQDRHG